MSVVGFNDMPFADRFTPPLTTIHIPHGQIGARAAELLLERIEDPGRDAADARVRADPQGAGVDGGAAARRRRPARFRCDCVSRDPGSWPETVK